MTKVKNQFKEGIIQKNRMTERREEPFSMGHFVRGPICSKSCGKLKMANKRGVR